MFSITADLLLKAGGGGGGGTRWKEMSPICLDAGFSVQLGLAHLTSHQPELTPPTPPHPSQMQKLAPQQVKPVHTHPVYFYHRGVAGQSRETAAKPRPGLAAPKAVSPPRTEPRLSSLAQLIAVSLSPPDVSFFFFPPSVSPVFFPSPTALRCIPP